MLSRDLNYATVLLSAQGDVHELFFYAVVSNQRPRGFSGIDCKFTHVFLGPHCETPYNLNKALAMTTSSLGSVR